MGNHTREGKWGLPLAMDSSELPKAPGQLPAAQRSKLRKAVTA